MTLALHWWRPLGNPRTAAGELVRHGSAWTHAISMGGRPINFGDEASCVALAELSGQAVRRTGIGQADVLGVGSILNKAWKARHDATVFGSGLRHAEHRPIAMPADRVLAVRGTLTRDALRLPADLPLGDPALVLGSVYGAMLDTPSRDPLFIPHFTMLAEREGRRCISALRSQGWDVQVPTTTPQVVARAIQRASMVATNSLHGIVFAHALGTPVIAVDVPGHAEPAFKYDDYMSVFGLRHDPVQVSALASTPKTALIDQVTPHTTKIAGALPGIVSALFQAASPLRSSS